MSESISDFVVIPEDAARKFREHLGLQPSQTPRIAFLAGPGDVAGTFDHWISGSFDPRVPVVAYSTMFYTLIDKLQAIALLIAEPTNIPENRDPRFRFVSIPRPRPVGRLSYCRANFAFSRRVVRELQSYEPHVVLVGTDTPWWIMSSIPRSTKIILTAHNNFWAMGRKSLSWKQRLKRRIESSGLRRVTAGVCTSEETRRQVIELSGKDGQRLYTEVPQVLARFLASVPRDGQLRTILFLGRLQAEKGVFDLLEAFEGIADRHPDTTLSFAGSGEAEDELRRRATSSRYGDRIRLLGRLNAEDVHQQLAETDVLVCPTRSEFPEGLALVVLEAAVHGVPTILSSVVPAKELVVDGCLEFPADDTEALEASLKSLAADVQKLQQLRAKVTEGRERFFNRSLSWGTMLYSALLW